MALSAWGLGVVARLAASAEVQCSHAWSDAVLWVVTQDCGSHCHLWFEAMLQHCLRARASFVRMLHTHVSFCMRVHVSFCMLHPARRVIMFPACMHACLVSLHACLSGESACLSLPACMFPVSHV
jgi:hypothetical protein